MSKNTINLPNFSYPFSYIDSEATYNELLATETTGNYLFNNKGLWHGGIHFSNSLTKLRANEGIRAIADGELVAYRVNEHYLQNDDEENEDEGLYSSGFFLLRHKLEYPEGNILNFFSLYMHTADINAYAKQEVQTYNVKRGDSLSVIANKYDTTVAQISQDNNIVNPNEIRVGQTLQITARSGLAFIVDNVECDLIKVLDTPKQIKAGEILGLVGEYNLPKDKGQQLLHVEVFSGDDVDAFAKEAKSAYENNSSNDKPNPTKVIVPESKELYEKIVTCKLSSDANIRVGFSNDSQIYNDEITKTDTLLQIEPSQSQTVGSHTRVAVVKIDGEDVSEQGYTVIDSVFKDMRIDFLAKERYSNKKVFALKDITKERCTNNEEYLLYDAQSTPMLYVKYAECQKDHGITLDWADIIDQSSNDDISVFESFKEFIFPKRVSEGIEINPLFKNLFKLIDTNQDGKLQTQELDEATMDIEVKTVASKFIVKHSSEWDDKTNMADTIRAIIDAFRNRVYDYDSVIKHLDNEKKRIENLVFFNECKTIQNFPQSDSVFHFHPIGLVGEFVGGSQLITKEMLNAICPNAGSNQELLNALNKYCPQYQINTPLRIAHFLAQTAHESGCFTSYGEGIYYRLSTALATWPSRNNDINRLSLDGRYLKQPDLFNAVYGTRNGNIAGTDDGYNFRGRGLIQLTGRTNYTNYQASHNAKNPDDIQDFINSPELIASKTNYAVESACWYWDSNQLNLLADKNTTDVTSVTRKVNGGTNGLTERQEFFDAVKKVLGI